MPIFTPEEHENLIKIYKAKKPGSSSNLAKEIGEIGQRQRDLEVKVTTVQGEVTTVKGEVTTVKGEVTRFVIDFNETKDELKKILAEQAGEHYREKCPNGTLKAEFVLEDISKIATYTVDPHSSGASVASLSDKFCIPHNVGIFYVGSTANGFYNKDLVGCNNISHVDGKDTYTLNMSGDQCVMTEVTS